MFEEIKRHYSRGQIKLFLTIAIFALISLTVTETSFRSFVATRINNATDNRLIMAQSSKLSILSSQTLKRKNSGGKQFDFPPDILQQVEEFKTKNQMKFESTIVSAFFELSPGNSKRGNNDYLEYMENFLCINDPVVVFTQPKYVNKMRELRSHAPDRTLIVPMELQDIEVGYNIHFSDEEWQNNCKLHIDRGCKNGFEKDGNLYKIWLAKSWFVNEALRLNPFGSDVFLWMDIGHLREGDFFCGDTVVRHPEIVPQDGRMLLFMWRGLKEGDELRYQNPIFSDGFYSFYIAGGSLAGRIDAWGHFLQKMEESMILYHERGVGIAEDQSIMQSTCMRNKGLCSVVRIDNDQGVGDGKGLCREGKYERFRMCLDRPGWRGNVNSFFQMKFRYYHGGPLKTFDPALGIPSRAEDPDFYFPLPATHNN